MKRHSITTSQVELIGKDDAFAMAQQLNPYVTWVRFILTDDKPNGNGDRIPLEEFSNLIHMIIAGS